MRPWFAVAAGLLIATMLHGEGLTAEADTTPHVLTFGDRVGTGTQPVVLRGSAIAPAASPAVESAAPQYQIAAGRRLWFFDPKTRDIRSCINQQTSTVGVRIVRCYPGTLGRYRRTFGVTFQP
jgi:hypothetical protein